MLQSQPIHQLSSKESETYDHDRYRIRRRVLRFLLQWIGFSLLARLERVEGQENIPAQGQAILMINHIAFIDPIVIVYATSRDIVPLAKIEVYDYPVVGMFPRIWGVIPIRRDEFDRRAIQQVMQVLNAGEMVLVAPEGTRGTSLRKGKVGIAYLASRSGAPIIPVTIEGTQFFPALRGSPNWGKGGVQIRYGEPFQFKPGLQRAKRDQLELMTDEAMYVLSKMLPEHRRGYYADLDRATQLTIQNLS